MCGFWLWIKKLRGEIVPDYHFQRVRERGPNETRVFEDESIKMAFHRLAIHDLSEKGSQPFVVHQPDDTTFWLLCNGEIYNYPELKREFADKIELTSHSDCEIILALFLYFQQDMSRVLDRIRGEFSMAIIKKDGVTGNITGYIARDPYGVRPLFVGQGGEPGGLFFSSLLKGLSGLTPTARQFPPGHVARFENSLLHPETRYYIPVSYPVTLSTPLEVVYREITDRLIRAVKRRLSADRPIGALLSGGLDSSLIVAIVYKILKQKVRVFTIGFEDSTDVRHAREVMSHLGIQEEDADIVRLDPKEGLDSLGQVIWGIETYDITTIRASVMQYKMAEYIRNLTNIRVILNGDGADELQMGYLYMKMAPDAQAAENETHKLLNEIHFFDGLRVDRSLGAFGLEARLPYLDVEFVDYMLSIPLEWRLPFAPRQEKELIRRAFAHCYPDILPHSVLFRQKEAFSDGVSDGKDSWHHRLRSRFREYKGDETKEFTLNPPFSGESRMYRETFDELFNTPGHCYDGIIPHFWQPNFTTQKDPSARELEVYQQDNHPSPIS